MAFDVILMQNKSPVEKIGKNLQAGPTITGVSLKKDCSILKPILHISTSDDIFEYNYMKISQFNNRFYFIDDIVSVGQNRWEISGHIDVLETYKQAILGNSVVLRRQENKFNTYLNDAKWPVYSYDDVITFAFSNSGFKKALEYLLIVSGG